MHFPAGTSRATAFARALTITLLGAVGCDKLGGGGEETNVDESVKTKEAEDATGEKDGESETKEQNAEATKVAPPEPTCDKALLNKISGELAPLQPHDQIQHVAAGLAPCAKVLPPQLTSLYRIGGKPASPSPETSPELDALRVRACPKVQEVLPKLAGLAKAEQWGAVFDGCDAGRFGVATKDDARAERGLDTWTMHQFLLDQGLSADEAKPITLALFAAERAATSPIATPDGFRPPHSTGDPIAFDVVVLVSTTEIKVGEKSVTKLDAGSVLPEAAKDGPGVVGLGDALGSPGKIGILTDASVPLATIQAVVRSLEKASVQSIGFVVEDEPFEYGQVVLPPAPFRDSRPKLRLFRDEAGFVVRSGSEPDKTLAVGDPQSLTKAAIDVRFADAQAHVAEVSGKPGAPIGDIVVALVALRGPDCTREKHKCFLPDLVLLPATEEAFGVPEIATGIPECDDLMKRSICMVKSVSGDDTTALEAMNQSVKAMQDLASNPDTKAAAVDACKQALEAGKDGFEASGC